MTLGWRRIGCAIALLGLLASRPARATYSIAAVDRATGQVGGAVTSCVGALDLSQVYGPAPGHGVIHAQAQLDRQLRGRNRAIQLLMQDSAPADIIAMISAANFDSGAASRQYGIVDLSGRSAGFTGAQAQMYKADDQGQIGTFSYSVQGNILTSQRVLDQAAAAFAADSCDLAERLMRALEAGAENGEGDSRCTPDGIPSDAAFIQVDLANGAPGSFLSLQVNATAPRSPLPALRSLFDSWRASHPCPAANGGSPAAGAGATSAAGSGGAAGIGPGAAGIGPGAAGIGPGAAGIGPGAAQAGARAGAAGNGGQSRPASSGTSASTSGAGASSGGPAATSGSSAANPTGGAGANASGTRNDAAQTTPPSSNPKPSSGCTLSNGPSSGAETSVLLIHLAALAYLSVRTRLPGRKPRCRGCSAKHR